MRLKFFMNLWQDCMELLKRKVACQHQRIIMIESLFFAVVYTRRELFHQKERFKLVLAVFCDMANTGFLQADDGNRARIEI